MTTVCIGANCLYGPALGGHTWVYLNWALGARAAGAEVVWLEGVNPATPLPEVERLLSILRSHLAPFGLADSVVLCSWSDEPLSAGVGALTSPLERAWAADAFLDLVYDLPPHVVEGFRRSALVNIDPGLLETWMERGDIRVVAHDVYLTTGARAFGDTIRWERTRPCVAVEQWPVLAAPPDAAFTSVTAWYANEWVLEDGEPVRNDKRSGYLPFLALPDHTDRPVELALDLHDDPEGERAALTQRGWRIADASAVAATPDAYRDYVSSSFGELGCCKPSYAAWSTGWISDRTVCYLASGKPVAVRDTGPNPLIDDVDGVFRFTTVEDAAACLEKCASDYERHRAAARALAEERFDARIVVADVLERTL